MRERVERKKNWIGAVGVALLFLVILFLSVKITDITVTGNKKYDSDQIVEMLFPDSLSRNTGICYLKDQFEPHQKIPFVEDYKIVFRSMSQIEIIVYEKSMVGCVSYMSSYMYFDKDGIIVESASEKLPGIPEITGLKFGHIVLYEKLPVESAQIFSDILNLTQVLSIYQIESDQIRFSSNGNTTLYIGDIDVVLGGSNDLNGKISELSDIMPQITGMRGTLYLDTYDEGNLNAMYAFKPRA
ncbi:cell division protein FtsQ/DivIB [Brotaphodocola sp.]|uniref:cell division protein FtsQ/DivIB n=1 Tax=Brotaphodocola sp. TaxID=3073577 RepID=UPI003D7CD5F5